MRVRRRTLRDDPLRLVVASEQEGCLGTSSSARSARRSSANHSRVRSAASAVGSCRPPRLDRPGLFVEHAVGALQLRRHEAAADDVETIARATVRSPSRRSHQRRGGRLKGSPVRVRASASLSNRFRAQEPTPQRDIGKSIGKSRGHSRIEPLLELRKRSVAPVRVNRDSDAEPEFFVARATRGFRA